MKKSLLLLSFVFCGIAASAQSAKAAELKPLTTATPESSKARQTPEEKKQADAKKIQEYKSAVEAKQKKQAEAAAKAKSTN
jgi:Skp family chaperone for outer membrane proteins